MADAVRAGQLLDRVTIEEETRVSNGQGGFTNTWAPIAATPVVWAKVIGQSGQEAQRAGIERAVTVYTVDIRKRADISAKNRLQWNGQVMAIKSVLPNPQSPLTFLQLLCETGAGSV